MNSITSQIIKRMINSKWIPFLENKEVQDKEIMDFPKFNSTYNEKEYWDKRYENEEHYEWFAGYKPYRDILRSNIKTTDRILTLGCGNSSLSEDMYHDGF